MIIRKSTAEIEKMANAGRIVADTIALLREHIRPGSRPASSTSWPTTSSSPRAATSSFKGYRGYPAAICTSPNDMVVHGIPNGRTVSEGDILSVDVGVVLDGFVADSAFTFAVGEISADAERLLEGCQAALAAGIAQCRAGNRLSDVSHAIQVATEEAGFSVVRSLVGHGIGRAMHEDPQIPNYGPPGRGPELQPGMTFAIEPMINAGGPDVYLHDDEWSISTLDGSLSAHFEHTVAVTEDGPRILTATPESGRKPFCYHEASLRAARLRVFSCPDNRAREARFLRGGMLKVRASVKPMCERCRVIRRNGRTMVICSNPRHKQRQG